MKPDLPLAGAAKSEREGEGVKGGEEKTKAESWTEAFAASGLQPLAVSSWKSSASPDRHGHIL